MTCPNCHSENTTKISKGKTIFGLVLLGVLGLLTVIAPIIAIVFITKTIKGPDSYKCQNCKKRFTETEAKAVTA